MLSLHIALSPKAYNATPQAGCNLQLVSVLTECRSDRNSAHLAQGMAQGVGHATQHQAQKQRKSQSSDPTLPSACWRVDAHLAKVVAQGVEHAVQHQAQEQQDEGVEVVRRYDALLGEVCQCACALEHHLQPGAIHM